MVKKISKSLGYFLFFMVSLMYLTPKVNIYYFIEKELKPHGVIISSENVQDKAYFLDVENLNISYKEIQSVKVENLSCYIFAIYNKITVNDIKLASALGSFVPINIQKLNVEYSIFNPLNIVANASGDFGEAKASFNIAEYSLHLDLKPSKIMIKSHQNTLKQLKKTENGEYTYDQSF